MSYTRAELDAIAAETARRTEPHDMPPIVGARCRYCPAVGGGAGICPAGDYDGSVDVSHHWQLVRDFWASFDADHGLRRRAPRRVADGGHSG